MMHILVSDCPLPRYKKGAIGHALNCPHDTRLSVAFTFMFPDQKPENHKNSPGSFVNYLVIRNQDGDMIVL